MNIQVILQLGAILLVLSAGPLVIILLSTRNGNL
uniref:Photosystem II reaction center protein Psb30 n=1 Tax=Neodangemannia microcystis TaxID=173495 RepID=A0A1W6EHB4_9CHLO|nr:hypothetical chloroplast RF12 [Neodangemannia microcystis]ARK14798.1 hypothetical chloroplast RF12 [Neodangemannia microcystis]